MYIHLAPEIMHTFVEMEIVSLASGALPMAIVIGAGLTAAA